MLRCRWGTRWRIAGLGLLVLVLTGCGGKVPATRTLTAADNGTTVQMAVGDELVIQLTRNPSTGYGGSVVAGDPAVLAHRARRCTRQVARHWVAPAPRSSVSRGWQRAAPQWS